MGLNLMLEHKKAVNAKKQTLRAWPIHSTTCEYADFQTSRLILRTKAIMQ